ncbi:hypothetical protein BGZ94_004677 [Podila epigama]|nr:hypothetical protein BGZ94_004677 [Podila epigama]
MAKFSSIIVLLATAVATFTTAAPVASPSPVVEVNSTIAIATATPSASPFVEVTTTAAAAATPTAVVDDETLVRTANIYSSSNKYQGKATWFTDSYGSCNIHWDGYKEPIVALSAQMMGVQSWGHPACNRRVQIRLRDNPSKTVTARVVDKCPGDQCSYGSLDLSPAAFKQLGDLVTGILNIEWNFI